MHFCVDVCTYLHMYTQIHIRTPTHTRTQVRSLQEQLQGMRGQMDAWKANRQQELQDGAEVCASGKRDLFAWQTRLICMAKEAYLHGKRGLFA